MDIGERSLKLHEDNKGKIEITSKVRVKTREDLTLAYSPGVAKPCLEIQKDAENVYKYTSKGNMVAVVTDGTAVLGLGNIGALAALPVMEGKCILFKEFSGVDAVPICLDTNDIDKIVETVCLLEPTYGGINLEDINAPRCFEIEKRLKERLNIPVFHDDQHGTAVVVTAGIVNALKVVGKKLDEIKVVSNGIGAAGTSIVKLLLEKGVKNMLLCDKNGILYPDCPDNIDNPVREKLTKITNPDGIKGSLKDALVGADVFIGTSVANAVTKEMAESMADDAVVMALANPNPEIMPDIAKQAGVKVICTGRSDYPNQVNNVLAFPGIFRGALDVRASDINEKMKSAAADAIASLISDDELNAEYVIPNPFDERVADAVAKAVAQAATESGVSRI